MKFIKQLAFLFLLAMLGVNPGYGQEGKHTVVTGKVSTSNGSPAGHVSVSVKGTPFGGQTDDEGIYRIELSQSGTLTLEISALGTASQSKNISKHSGGTYTLDFTIDITSQQL